MTFANFDGMRACPSRRRQGVVEGNAAGILLIYRLEQDGYIPHGKWCSLAHPFARDLFLFL